jgi:hypothetical protein
MIFRSCYEAQICGSLSVILLLEENLSSFVHDTDVCGKTLWQIMLGRESEILNHFGRVAGRLLVARLPQLVVTVQMQAKLFLLDVKLMTLPICSVSVRYEIVRN